LIFLDTSVLIAIAQVNHIHRAPSRKLWEQCTILEASISTHALAEVYGALTAMPPGMRISPRDAVAAIDTFLLRLAPVALSAEEYIETLRGASDRGHSGGMIYDALHLASARKVNAERIYTWNLKHFRAVAPDFADRIMTP
jgi:predicted nucleic acid-binding protein